MPTKWEERPTTYPLGAIVRAGRNQLRLTQQEFADRVGVSQAYISSMERGSVRMPDVEIRRRLADALGMTHVDLLIGCRELEPEEVTSGPSRPAVSPYQQKLDGLDPETRRTIERIIDDAWELKGLRG